MTRTSPSSTASRRGDRAPSRGRALARKVAERAASAVVVLWGAATVAFFAQLLLPGRPGHGHPQHPSGTAAASARPRSSRRSSRSSGSTARCSCSTSTTCAGSWSGDFGTSYQQFRPVTDDHRRAARRDAGALARRHRDRLGAHGRLGHAHRGSRAADRRRSASASTSWPRACRTTGSGSSCCWSSRSACDWFPVIGGTGTRGLVLPALTLAIPLAGFLGQATRAEFEKGARPAVRLTARMRGMGDLARAPAATCCATPCCRR